MRQVLFEIRSNRRIARDIYELCLLGDSSAVTAPGQFVDLRLPGFYLRRPISVCDWGEGTLRLIYKVQGKGTAALGDDLGSFAVTVYYPGLDGDVRRFPAVGPGDLCVEAVFAC